MTLHGIVAGLPATPPAVVPAWPPHASGYRVALDEGDWWAYRGRDTRVERAYCPAHHEDAVGVEGAAAA